MLECVHCLQKIKDFMLEIVSAITLENKQKSTSYDHHYFEGCLYTGFLFQKCQEFRKL